MMRTLLTCLASTIALATLIAQPYDPLHPPDTYRNADNPYYWKNRPPYPGYWQQDVHYRIKARLDENTDVADGSVILTYWNNSPDTLREVFFHLYQNAYNAGSYLEKQERAEGGEPWDTTLQRGTEVSTLKMDGQETERVIDNTVMRVSLPRPIAPGGHTVFEYTFRTHWQGGGRRMKLFNAWGYKHYDGTHWYPRISVYDKQRGWDTDQHLGHEFYGDFGTYDVELDMPNNMIVEATGQLQEPELTLPPELRAKLDIGNFKDKPWNEKPSEPIPYDAAVRRKWSYHAENVHDFAFTADPTYRIGQTEWNGVKCIAMAQEPHAAKWQNAADYCAKVIRSHSTNFGMYAYPKMVVADARDGMEYPMLTLDSGNEPNYRGLFAHEIGHNWFFGMVGNNETYRAMLDEGFTQFLTAFGLTDIDGDIMVEEPRRTRYEERFADPVSPREDEVYRGYMIDAIRDDLPPINTHSDGFGYYTAQGRGGYRHVYMKTATMLYNLQYVLGDTLFQQAMKHYFNQWKIAHPTVEDFRNSIIGFTRVDLNWFFDQWIDTDKRIDYAVVRVKHRGADRRQEIVLKRKGGMEMPIDLEVVAKDGTRHDFHIPNGWFVKETKATVLPRWIGHDDLQRTYTAHVDIRGGIADVRIDTTYRLADAYQLNNSLRLPFEAVFDNHVWNPPDRRVYQGFVRPDLWWNGFDGLKGGVHFHSSWMNYKHKLWATAWINTGIGQYLPNGTPTVGYDPISFNVRYENGTEKLLRGSRVEVAARMLDGLERYAGALSWDMPDGRTTMRSSLRFLLRRTADDMRYLIHPGEWERNALNSAWDNSIEHRYDTRGGQGVVSINVRNSSIGSAHRFAQATLTASGSDRIGPLSLRTRLIAQFGTGDTPRESQLYLAGASPEEMMENKYTRSVGFVPYDQGGYGSAITHFQAGGGLGLRGYAGYVAPESMDSTLGGQFLVYRGNTGAAFNAELDLDGLVRLRPKATREWLHLDVYLFGDIGSMGYRRVTDGGSQQLRFAYPRADAGAGLALTIKKFGPLDGIKPLTIRFDAPLFVSSLPNNEQDHFAFRYVIGIERAF